MKFDEPFFLSKLCGENSNCIKIWQEYRPLHTNIDVLYICDNRLNGAAAPSGPPHYRRLTITLRHTTLRRNPLDE